MIAFKQFAVLLAATLSMIGWPTLITAQEQTLTVATEVVSFETNDVQAAQIARQMYGEEFSHVRAVRVLLEAPSDDPEQLFVELGNGKDCETDCVQVVLFHNEQWLEIYRQPKAERIGLTEVTATGMKSIIADGRIWSWNATNYVPEPARDGLIRREASETELAVITEQISGGFDAGGLNAFGPPEIDVFDVDMNGYPGKIVAVRSPTVCGQSSCPIYLLNAEDQIFRVLRSIEGEVGLARNVRDEQGFRGIELLTRNGISIVSSSSGKRLSSLAVQQVYVAGMRP
jgi:hypothetical protein